MSDSEIIISHYTDKSILITGGGGFVGSALVDYFSKIRCKISVLHNKKKTNNVGGTKNNSSKASMANIEHLYGDISSRCTWDKIISSDTYIVFHLAAIEINSTSIVENDLKVNALSILHMLESCVEKKINPKVIFSSSTNIFGSNNTVVNEKTYDNPLAFWSAHKLLAENYLKIYHQTSGLKAITLRLPNIYGPVNDINVMERMVVNKVIKYGIENGKITVFNNNHCYRDYLFISDVVNAFLISGLIDDKDYDGRYYVLGGNKLVTIKDVWEIIAKKIGNVEIELNDKVQLEPIEMRSYIGDFDSFHRKTGWRPSINLDNGIDITVSHVKKCVV